MGSAATNARDRVLDNAWLGHSFSDAGSKVHRKGYDAHMLTKYDGKCGTISYQQQVDGLHQRFHTAKTAYEQTGEHKYLMMQKDLREIATSQLDADGRQWRLSKK